MSEPERRELPDRRQRPRPGGRRANDPPAEWVSVSDYAHRYGIDRSTVYKWLGEALLETYRVGRLLRIKNKPPNEHYLPESVDRR